MAFKKISLMLMVVGLLGAWLGGRSALAENETISGELVDGLRIVRLVPGQENHFVVYRGDYVQPQLAGGGQFEIDIPGLRQVKEFPAKEGDKAYVKMTKSGEFPFSAGDIRGIFKVIDYAAPSYTEVSSKEAELILANTNPFILDVRTPGEYRQEHIAGAHLIPVQVLQQELAQLEPYKERDIFVYCATGNRSTVAARILIENGFKKIYNLRDGISGWLRQGYPVER